LTTIVISFRRVVVAVSAVVVLATVIITSGGGWAGGGQRSENARFSPVVNHTGRAPTGYTVTFRYRDQRASSVLIQGEWYFSNPARTTMTSTQGLLPSQWKPGDFAIGWPANQPDNWPIISMKKNPSTGVWSYTTPLPSGYYNYGFYVNCSLSAAVSNPYGATAACTEISDPSNPPWNDHNGISTGSVETRSQVYVPSDPAFHDVDYLWEAPTSPKGALKDVSYQSLASASAPHRRGVNFLAIYTPHGYEQHRSTPYPTLYLSPGSGANEVDWSTQADAANILDNLIDKHLIEPMVVVMTNTGCPAPEDCMEISGADYDQDLLDAVVPYVQAHYDVSGEPSERAFAGLSFGGELAGTLLVNDTSKFGYFGLFSPCPSAVPAPTTAQVAGIRHVSVMVGGGLQDAQCHSYAVDDVSILHHTGAHDVTDFVDGGHDWNVWRRLLRDFLTQVAFRPVNG
jgi:enterochelin esterase-like enzyme